MGGTYVQLSLNFQFDRVQARHSVPLTVTNGQCNLPRRLGAFPKPTFYAGCTALAAVLFGFDYLTRSPCIPKDHVWVLVQTLLVFVSMPAVIVASAATAWIRGELKEWWTYEQS